MKIKREPAASHITFNGIDYFACGQTRSKFIVQKSNQIKYIFDEKVFAVQQIVHIVS